MTNNWIELKRFLKDHAFFMILTSILFAILFTVVASLYTPPKVLDEVDVQVQDPFTKDSRRARFQVYIENEDGNPFINNNLLINYFALETEIEKIKTETGVNIEKVNEELVELGLEEEVVPIHAYKDSGSGLIILTINVGNEKDNIKVADYVYDSIVNQKIPFLASKNVYSFDNPKLMERESKGLGKKNAEGNLLSQRPDTSVSTLLKNGLVGWVVGLVLAIGLAFVRALTGKKLNYNFTYHVEDDEEAILYDSSLKNEKYISHFVGIPYGKNKIVLSEHPLAKSEKLLLIDAKGVSFVESDHSVVHLKEEQTLNNIEINREFSEIIIVIKPYQTTRKWYKNQKTISELYGKPVKIIQINQ